MTNKVSAIQMVSTASIKENLNTAARLITKAAEGGSKLILLPEVFAVLEGGPMRAFGEIEGNPDAQLQNFLSQQASNNKVIIVGGTIPLISRPSNGDIFATEIIEGERVRPACLVFDESGVQIARYDKIHLFDVIVNDKQSEYSESRSYEPGTSIISVDTSVGNLGLSICYDVRFPELYRELFKRGAELITVPAAFTKVTGEAHWESLLRARAIENQCYVIAAGQGGKHSESRETWGHSMIIDPWGTILAMVEEGEGVATAEINLEFVKKVRARMPIREQQKLG
jgi:predicted amidohydrolase